MNKRRRNRLKDDSASAEKVGWRPAEWGGAVGVSRASVYNLLVAGAIDSVKVGSARVITTTPRDYLASLAKEAA
jgi:hypothetical protein